MSDRIYCYPESDVLIHKLDIHDLQTLQDAERDLTSRRLLQLQRNPIQGGFDYSHLKQIHKFVFQDIYTWAGEEHAVDIAKSNLFCNVRYLQTQADEIFGNLRDENHLEGLQKEPFIIRVAYYFGEINALHPFREGNGRTQREFFRELARNAGHEIDFSNITESEMLSASMDSFMRKYDKLIALLEMAVLY